MTPKIEHLLAGVGVPETDRAVVAGCCETATVGREGHDVDLGGVAAEVPDELAGVGVEEGDSPAGSGDGEKAAVGREGDGVAERVPLGGRDVEREHLSPRGEVPEFHGVSEADRGQPSTVRREGEGDHSLGVGRQDA